MQQTFLFTEIQRGDSALKVNGYCHRVAIEYSSQQAWKLQPNLTRPGPCVFKPEPDAARHAIMNCLPEPDPPCACIVFLLHLFLYAAASGLCLPLPMKQAARLTLHHTWTSMIHNKQYIIYNLQEMCFIKKEARGPTRPGSLVFFRPEPAGLVGFVGPAWPVENSTIE